MKSIHCSILTRALMTGVASLAFVIMETQGAHAETVISANGADGANGVNFNDPGGPGGEYSVS